MLREVVMFKCGYAGTSDVGKNGTIWDEPYAGYPKVINESKKKKKKERVVSMTGARQPSRLHKGIEKYRIGTTAPTLPLKTDTVHPSLNLFLPSFSVLMLDHGRHGITQLPPKRGERSLSVTLKKPTVHASSDPDGAKVSEIFFAFFFSAWSKEKL